MNLLQISEPETIITSDHTTHAIGIDLGTTNSVVACYRNGKVEILGDIVPSIVSYGSDSHKVGIINENHQLIRSIKRLIGKKPEELQNYDQYKLLQIENDPDEAIIRLKLGDKIFTPIEISAHILSHLKKQAEGHLKHKVDKAVITVPAYFDDAARNATKAAAKIAGLEVLRLINEPTAAAVAYGLEIQAEGVYLIYDFGGGTFDVSILKMQKGVFQVLATGGDVNLGGDDIDHLIAQYFKIEDPNFHPICRQIKENLTISNHTEITWQDQKFSLTNQEFEKIAAPIIRKTIQIMNETISHSGIDPLLIKEIILVGGSTRSTLVKQMITKAIKPPLDNINPDLVVAMGAALQADALIHGADHLLLDVTSLSIGLEVMGGINERIISKNSTIPLKVSKSFTTYQDGQTGIIFHIVQGEREMAHDCRSLAKFELKGIPPMHAGQARVKAIFTIDADGLLTVTAEEETTGIKQEVIVKPSYGLTQEEIETMLEQSYEYAAEDIKAKQLVELKLTAQNNITSLTIAIKEDQNLLSAENLEQILILIDELKDALKEDSVEKIEKTNFALEAKSGAFIQQRLNRQIKEILQGKSTVHLAEILKEE